jgi:hypothetical protein
VGINFSVIGRKIGGEIEKFVHVIFEARKGDNRRALLFNSPGEDSVPLDDERLILVKVDGTGKYAACAVLTLSQGAKPGEKIFFARDPDAKTVSKISMLNDGAVSIENEGDYTQKTKGKSVHKAAEINFESDAPIGLNNGLYSSGLQPYLLAENTALTALQSMAGAAAVPDISMIPVIASGLSAFCATMLAAIETADKSISKVVK